MFLIHSIDLPAVRFARFWGGLEPPKNKCSTKFHRGSDSLTPHQVHGKAQANGLANRHSATLYELKVIDNSQVSRRQQSGIEAIGIADS